MGEQPTVTVTDEDRARARAQAQRVARGATAATVLMVALTSLLAAIVATSVAPDAAGSDSALLVAGFALVFALPPLVGVSRIAIGKAVEEAAVNEAHRARDDQRGAPPRLRHAARRARSRWPRTSPRPST